jgi:hypothetical protein
VAGAKAKDQGNRGEGERREKYIGLNPVKCLFLNPFRQLLDRPKGLNKPRSLQASAANPDDPVTIYLRTDAGDLLITEFAIGYSTIYAAFLP